MSSISQIDTGNSFRDPLDAFTDREEILDLFQQVLLSAKPGQLQPGLDPPLGLSRFDVVGELGIYFFKKGSPRCRKNNRSLHKSLNRKQFAWYRLAARASRRWPATCGSGKVPCIIGTSKSPNRESRRSLDTGIRRIGSRESPTQARIGAGAARA
jgi:hypothetical protein